MSRRLNDWIGSWLELNKETEPPQLYKFWCGMSVVAAALQRKCYVPWGTLTFYPNIYVILIGPPGKSRKGLAMKPALEMIQELGIYVAAESTTREGLIRALFESQDTVVDNETGESFTHSSLTIFSAELTVFLGYQNYQLMSDLSDWFDCRTMWTHDTKTQGTDKIRGVFVNLLGATTPELIRSTLPMDAIGGGLTSRIIFVNESKKDKINPAPFMSSKEVKLKEDLFYDLEQIYRMKGPFKVNSEFLERWFEWYYYQEYNPPFSDPFFDGYMSRRATHVMKMSCILAAARRESKEIKLDDFEDALAMLERTEVKMVETFRGVGRSGTADILSSIMTTIGNSEKISRSELLRHHYRDVKDEYELDRLIKTLESTGFCKRSSEDGVQIIIHNSREKITPVKRDLNERGY